MTASTIVYQHDEWHRIFGKYTTCPLDCGSGEIVSERFEADAQALEAGAKGIRCYSCSSKENKGYHASVAMVRFCHEVKRDAETFERNNAAMLAELEAAGECEHGLSAALCFGPGHYPIGL